jgi:hypothetical protein
LCGIFEVKSLHQLTGVNAEPMEYHHAWSVPAEPTVALELYGLVISKNPVEFVVAAKLHQSHP